LSETKSVAIEKPPRTMLSSATIKKPTIERLKITS